jgi:hypothetical protein
MHRGKGQPGSRGRPESFFKALDVFFFFLYKFDIRYLLVVLSHQQTLYT